MKKPLSIILVMIALIGFSGCGKTYKAKPISFKAPSAYKNTLNAGGAQIAAQAFVEKKEATEAFGFDIRGAGMLPVQLVFDHHGTHPLRINERQVFLEDQEGNLWPILDRKIAQERATKYAKTKEIFKEGAYTGFLGAAAGSLIGAAIGVVSGEDVARAAGEGAAVGAATGATVGGMGGYGSNKARQDITADLHSKSLENKAIEPGGLSHGILFFPGEANTVKQLRVQLVEGDTGNVHSLIFKL